MYVIEPSFWLKLLLLITVYFVLMALFNIITRRLLGVEKPKAFSHNHVNDQHKKIDWSVRIFFIVVMIVGGFLNVTVIPGGPYLLLQPWFLLFVLIFVTEIIRAIMQRNYEKNSNSYVFTISQLAFILVLLTLLFATNFFGIIEPNVLTF